MLRIFSINANICLLLSNYYRTRLLPDSILRLILKIYSDTGIRCQTKLTLTISSQIGHILVGKHLRLFIDKSNNSYFF